MNAQGDCMAEPEIHEIGVRIDDLKPKELV